MHENRNLFLFLIEINNMHSTRHILPIPRTCIWRRCGRCRVSWHRMAMPLPWLHPRLHAHMMLLISCILWICH